MFGASLSDVVLHLMQDSDVHSRWTVKQFHTNILPPLHFGTFALWCSDEGAPMAFASWASLTHERAEKYAQEHLKGRSKAITPTEWIAGDEIWIMDFIAPYGGAPHFFREWTRRFEPGTKLQGIRTKIIDGQKVRTRRHVYAGKSAALGNEPFAWSEEFPSTLVH